MSLCSLHSDSDGAADGCQRGYQGYTYLPWGIVSGPQRDSSPPLRPSFRLLRTSTSTGVPVSSSLPSASVSTSLDVSTGAYTSSLDQLRFDPLLLGLGVTPSQCFSQCSLLGFLSVVSFFGSIKYLVVPEVSQNGVVTPSNRVPDPNRLQKTFPDL